MALKRWVPAKNMESFFRDLFDDSLSSEAWKRLPSLRNLSEFEDIFPAVDMYDEGDELVVKAQVPGVDKDNIKISISDNTLTIKGEMKKEEETKEEDYYYSECSYGSFMRALKLPAKVEEKKIKASFKDGILEMHMPKAIESKPKEIKVNVN